MKNLVSKLGLVAALASVLLGCSKENVSENNTDLVKSTRKVSVVAGEDTKTALELDGQTITWSPNDVLTLIEISDEGEELNRKPSTATELTNSNRTATFSFKLDDFAGLSETFTYRAILAFRDIELNDADHNEYYVKNSQNPTATSFDPKADLLVAKQQIRNTQLENGESLSFNFARVVAINKMTLTGLEANEDVQSVSFFTDDRNEGTPQAIAGEVTFAYDIEGNPSVASVNKDVDGYDNYRVTMVYDDETADAEGKFDVYFTTLTTTLTDHFYVRVITDQNYYEKRVDLKTLGRTVSFVIDKLNTLSIDLSENREPITFNQYQLVTDVATIEVGDEIVIAAADADYAMGAQNGNYRNRIEITKDGNVISVNNDVTPVTVVAGNQTGTFALKTSENKYLSFPGPSNNYLKEADEVNDASSWYITNATNVTHIYAYSTYTSSDKFEIQYSSANTRFSCYKGTQNAISIYRATLVNDKPAIIAPSIVNVTSDAQETSIAYSVQNMSDDVKVIDYDGAVVEVAIVDEGSLEYSVSANTTGDVRQGYITLASEAHPDVTKNIVVNQLAAGNTITLETPVITTFDINTTSLTATWSSVENADTYTYKLFKDGEEVVSNTIDETSISLEDSYAIGSYVLKVQASNTNPLYSDSEWAVSEPVEVKAPVTITFVNSNAGTETSSVIAVGTQITFPDDPETSNEWSFAGWSLKNADIEAGDICTNANKPLATVAATYYAVFNKVASIVGTLVESVPSDWTGDYVIANTKTSSASVLIADGSISGTTYSTADAVKTLSNAGMTLSSNTLTGVTNAYIFTILNSSTNGKYNIKLKGASSAMYLIASSSSSSSSLSTSTSVDDSANWTIGGLGTGGNVYLIGNSGRYLGWNSSYFRAFAASNKDAYKAYLYKVVTTYNYSLICSAPVSYTITCDDNLSNGSVSASVASAYEGDEITLTATPADGYVLSSWNVTRTDNSDAVEVVNNKFTMPASNVTVSATFAEAGAGGGGTPVTYSFTITENDFTTSSYADNNVTHSSTATCTTDNSKTMTVEWYSYQIYQNSSLMQWQSGKGYIYNVTNLGEIQSVNVTTKAGTFSTFYGSTEQHPTSGETVGGSYFTVKVGSALGKTSSIVVTFTVTE